MSKQKVEQRMNTLTHDLGFMFGGAQLGIVKPCPFVLSKNPCGKKSRGLLLLEMWTMK